jgi:hypothetical protein
MAFMEQPVGRLVWILEYRLSPESRAALPDLIARLGPSPEPTFVAGLGPPCTLAAAKLGKALFYNRHEHLPPSEMGRMLPWREVWLVGHGRVWRTTGGMVA